MYIINMKIFCYLYYLTNAYGCNKMNESQGQTFVVSDRDLSL